MLGSRTFDVNVADERELRLAGGRADLIETGADLTIKAPIPGLVIRVMVGVGDQVEAKQPLVILEAMKMENELRAPRAGIITDVRVKAGESVEQGAGLLVLS
ncbi:MAG: acetyl-CoA carboxylase biotin carboxyl carrier protein subunit [Caldilineales bacterium]|nr:acetyl-CoA carboxylase biotin carboxyl carrier protein subunit [Caldilineales bacterium]